MYQKHSFKHISIYTFCLNLQNLPLPPKTMLQMEASNDCGNSGVTFSILDKAPWNPIDGCVLTPGWVFTPQCAMPTTGGCFVGFGWISKNPSEKHSWRRDFGASSWEVKDLFWSNCSGSRFSRGHGPPKGS